MITSAPIKPILRYPGSKWRLASWIVEQLPPHDVYLEPFFGSGAVFLTKPPSRVEIVNDLSGNVVTFFRVLRERPDELERAIVLTPYSREEYDLAHGAPADDDLERARRFFVRCWMSYGGKLGSKSGWRAVWDGSAGVGKRTPKISAVSLWRSLPPRLGPTAERLTNAIIECRPALEAIRLYGGPSTAIFCDPPYLPETLVHGSSRRDGSKRINDQSWAHYYEETMTADDHVELLEALDRHAGPVLLSGYRSQLYDDRLEHWTRLDRSEISMLSKPRTESLWINPVAAATARQPMLMEVG